MKKHVLFFVGLFVVVILVSLVMTFWQVGWPWSQNQKMSQGFDFGVTTASRAEMAPALDSGASASDLSRKITKTGNLSILVETAETTAQDIKTIAESVTGYVSDSYLYEVTPGVKAGAITVRVPANKFDQTISLIKELALKVENETISTNDVTEQFIDLEARLKNLKAQETQYLDLLKKSTKIEDVLSVTNQLNQVRQQIDSWQGQLKYLNSQIDLATITVNLTAEREVQIFGLNWRPITVIKQAVRSLLNGLMNYANVIIAVIIFLPVIILWLATIVVVLAFLWGIVKGLRRLVDKKKITEKANKKTKKSAS